MKVSQRGFTLVETIMGLAIAGFIVVIVFLGLNQAAVLRRDSQRKADLARFISAVRQYANDNSGAYPNSDAQLQTVISTYITNNGATSYTDPSGANYNAIGYTNDGSAYYGTYGVPDLNGQPQATIVAHSNAICYSSSTDPLEIGLQSTSPPGIPKTGTQTPSNRNFAAALKLESGGVACMEIN